MEIVLRYLKNRFDANSKYKEEEDYKIYRK